MNKRIFKFLMLFTLIFTMGIGMSSCGDDKDDEPSAVVGTVKITNNSSYTLEDFRVNFVNSRNEVITRESKGTLKPKNSVSVDIPIGAEEYYMGTVVSGITFWSANYKVSVKNQVLTDQTVGEWSN